MKVLHERPLLYSWTHSLGVLTLGSCVSVSKITSQDEPRLPVRQSVSDSSGAGLSQTPNSQSPWSLAGARGQAWRLVGRASWLPPAPVQLRDFTNLPLLEEKSTQTGTLEM